MEKNEQRNTISYTRHGTSQNPFLLFFLPPRHTDCQSPLLYHLSKPGLKEPPNTNLSKATISIARSTRNILITF
ncbi:hypothetical protein TMatcc_005585 [Talaromyces marneffei ATCC 18224]